MLQAGSKSWQPKEVGGEAAASGGCTSGGGDDDERAASGPTTGGTAGVTLQPTAWLPHAAGPEFEVHLLGHPKSGGPEGHEGQLAACAPLCCAVLQGSLAEQRPALCFVLCMLRLVSQWTAVRIAGLLCCTTCDVSPRGLTEHGGVRMLHVLRSPSVELLATRASCVALTASLWQA